MKLRRSLIEKRLNIIINFKRLGFVGRVAFYNVCKSIDTTLSDFDIVDFYDYGNATVEFTNKMESIVNTLRYE